MTDERFSKFINVYYGIITGFFVVIITTIGIVAVNKDVDNEVKIVFIISLSIVLVVMLIGVPLVFLFDALSIK
jgi:hypothetical protein